MMLTMLAQAQPTTGGDEIFLIWGLILLAAAVVLLALEFLLPSGGLIAVLCAVAAIGSVICFGRYNTTLGVAAGVTYVVGTPVILWIMFKIWASSPLAKRMVLGDVDPSNTDLEETAREAEQERLKRLAELQKLIGAEGVTETALRPVGTIRINDQRIDGMAETGVIEAKVPIVVTDVYDNQVKVRPR